MNLREISGDSATPPLWLFFATVAGMNLLVMVYLACVSWIHSKRVYGKMGFFEALKSAF